MFKNLTASLASLLWLKDVNTDLFLFASKRADDGTFAPPTTCQLFQMITENRIISKVNILLKK